MKNVFSKSDFNSNDGMMTHVWGPSLWHTLHTISFNYAVNPTEDDKTNYYTELPRPKDTPNGSGPTILSV